MASHLPVIDDDGEVGDLSEVDPACSNPFHPFQTIYKPYCVDAASRNHRLKWLLPYDTAQK
jgi:hypothetical protein